MADCDVVIVGSGMVGLCAAATATDGAGSVFVIESSDEIGGSSRVAGGQMMGAGTRIQKESGIDDSADDLFRHYYVALNEWTVEPSLDRRLADESGPAIDWLAELGMPFHAELSYSGDEAVPRDHVPTAFGMGVIGTLEELGTTLGVPLDNLRGAIDHYNSDLAVGEDASYLKPTDFGRLIATPPCYGTELRLSLLCLTSTGLRVDRYARVINRLSQPGPGLFAAGECTGGVLGDIYVGSGNSFTNCLVFGRVAGRCAAQEAQAHHRAT